MSIERVFLCSHKTIRRFEINSRALSTNTSGSSTHKHINSKRERERIHFKQIYLKEYNHFGNDFSSHLLSLSPRVCVFLLDMSPFQVNGHMAWRRRNWLRLANICKVASGIIRQKPFVGHHVTVLMSSYSFRLSFFVRSFVFFSLLCGYLSFRLIISINCLRTETWRFFLQTNQLIVVFFGFLFRICFSYGNEKKNNEFNMWNDCILFRPGKNDHKKSISPIIPDRVCS